MSHTPGPWEWDGPVWDYDKTNEAPWLITAAYATGIELALSKGVVLRGEIHCESEANARLIAAAPELLEALQALHKAGGIWPDLLPKVEAAIAKATGEQA